MITPPRLAERLERVLQLDRSAASRLASIVLATGTRPHQEIGRELRFGGLARRWNKTLDADRARYLASVISGRILRDNCRILDVLSGTGSLARALREAGHTVVEIERLEQYGRPRDEDTFDFALDKVHVAAEKYDAAIVVTVLHHEPHPDALIGWLAELDVEQYVVVENVRCREADVATHRLFDTFFNECLNDFGAECPGWYWTRQQWRVSLQSLGSPSEPETLHAVPGIPFPYDVFVITRDT